MKTGTLNAAVEAELARIRERSLGGGGLPGQGGSGGRDGGPDDDWRQDLIDTNEQNSDKSRVVTWVTLTVVLMTFGGLIGAYIVIATNNVLEWKPFALPIAVWVSTALIALSSITYYLGERANAAGETDGARKYFIATAGLGGMFIASQLIAWIALSARGLYVQGNPYAGFFYILTAVHAVHVFGGIAALGWVLLRSWEQARDNDEKKYRVNLARAVGYYWHFMGVLWFVLFVLLGFWK